MTVRMPSVIKDVIVGFYIHKTYNLRQLAKQYLCSERTIRRILQERGLATPVARIQGEAYLTMRVCKKHGIRDAADLDRKLIYLNQVLTNNVQHPTPFSAYAG